MRCQLIAPWWCISIHALLAESDPAHGCIGSADNISIHALLAESDLAGVLDSQRLTAFLSTLSLRRATGFLCGAGGWQHISIHALLAESDRHAAA